LTRSLEALTSTAPTIGHLAAHFGLLGRDGVIGVEAALVEADVYVARMLVGSEAVRPQPAPRVEPPAPPPMPPDERVVVYTLEKVKWIESDGSTRCVPQYSQASIPAALVERARKANLIDPSGDPPEVPTP
jgi:hypothetical protein